MTVQKLLFGHVLDRLVDLESESINCVVTSPPYWGLRSYDGVVSQWPDGWEGQFGHEPTSELYVEHTLDVLRGIRRVLRPDGVVWWNIGDGYSNKNMDLVPFRVALAAKSDGWWVRSVIVWQKSNATPESVTDRPTKSHEYILMLTKSERYWYDADAVRESHTKISLDRLEYEGRRQEDRSTKAKRHGGLSANRVKLNPRGRNARSVWTFAKAQSKEAHFAVFPEELPRRCIKASCPCEVCAKCGYARERVTENKVMEIRRTNWGEQAGNRTAPSGTMLSPSESKTVGWTSCDCAEPDYQPGLVLDPFVGTGTSLKVTEELGVNGIGIEISKEYGAMVRKSIPDIIVEEETN